MKIARFVYNDELHYGVVNKDSINIIEGSIFENYQITDKNVNIKDVKLLIPCTPSKAVCVGLNYREHAKEMNLTIPQEPIMFIKPATALNNPYDCIKYPSISNDVHYEAELAIVIKKEAYKISKEDANEYILGYTCANDVTARDIQAKDGQWTRAKSFNTFLPLGPTIETDVDPHNLDVNLYLNNELKQSSNTKEFIFKVEEIIEFVTEVMTLYPGDVILTGTPSGVGAMEIGDTVVVDIEGIGRLENRVCK